MRREQCAWDNLNKRASSSSQLTPEIVSSQFARDNTAPHLANLPQSLLGHYYYPGDSLPGLLITSDYQHAVINAARQRCDIEQHHSDFNLIQTKHFNIFDR